MLSQYAFKELEQIENRYKTIKENYNNLKRNPEYIYEIFEKAPYLFSILWKTTSELRYMPLTDISCVQIHFVASYERDFYDMNSLCTIILEDFCGYKLDTLLSMQENSDNDIEYEEIKDELSEFYRSTFREEINNLNKLLNGLTVVYEEFDYNEPDGDDIYLHCNIDFFMNILKPIYQGGYNEYFESLYKKCIVKYHLTNKK